MCEGDFARKREKKGELRQEKSEDWTRKIDRRIKVQIKDKKRQKARKMVSRGECDIL